MRCSYPTENTATGGLSKSSSTPAEPQPLWPLVATNTYKKYTNCLFFFLSLLCKSNMCIWKMIIFVINCKGSRRVFPDIIWSPAIPEPKAGEAFLKVLSEDKLFLKSINL